MKRMIDVAALELEIREFFAGGGNRLLPWGDVGNAMVALVENAGRDSRAETSGRGRMIIADAMAEICIRRNSGPDRIVGLVRIREPVFLDLYRTMEVPSNSFTGPKPFIRDEWRQDLLRIVEDLYAEFYACSEKGVFARDFPDFKGTGITLRIMMQQVQRA